MRSSLTGILLLFFCTTLYGQKLLFHKNRHKHVFYEIGDNIAFNLKDNKTKISATITDFQDSVIVFQGFKVNPSDISHVYVDSKTVTWFVFRYKYTRLFLYTGIGYFLVDVVNSGEVSEETVAISGTLVGAGLLAKLLVSDRLPIKGKRKLLIVDGG